MSARTFSRALMASSAAGVLLSVYALYIEMALEAKPDYKAYCDISEHMSCSRVLGSKYSKGFGIAAEGTLVADIPNCVHGLAFYLLIIFLATFDDLRVVKLQILLCWLSVAVSVYLAYVLYFMLYDLCLVCVSTYAVNVINLLLARRKYVAVQTELESQAKKKH